MVRLFIVCVRCCFSLLLLLSTVAAQDSWDASVGLGAGNPVAENRQPGIAGTIGVSREFAVAKAFSVYVGTELLWGKYDLTDNFPSYERVATSTSFPTVIDFLSPTSFDIVYHLRMASVALTLGGSVAIGRLRFRLGIFPDYVLGGKGAEQTVLNIDGAMPVGDPLRFILFKETVDYESGDFESGRIVEFDRRFTWMGSTGVSYRINSRFGIGLRARMPLQKRFLRSGLFSRYAPGSQPCPEGCSEEYRTRTIANRSLFTGLLSVSF